jgi:hypothetical protein
LSYQFVTEKAFTLASGTPQGSRRFHNYFFCNLLDKFAGFGILLAVYA